MRNSIYLLLVFCITVMLTGCAENADAPLASGMQAPTAVQTITASDARVMIDSEDETIILDVRTRTEFEQAHIEGALLIPVDELEARALELLPDKDQIILIYCRSGNRSANAARMLMNMGYTAVFDFGGIMSWPYGTVSVG